MSISLAIGADFPASLDPRLFRSINSLCKDAIAYSGNHIAIRASVNGVLQQLRKISTDKFGHDSTIDCNEIRSVLQRTDPREPKQPKVGRRDPIECLLEDRKLLPDQYESAVQLRQVYSAFGRVFSLSARDYRKPRSGGNVKYKTPVDLIPTDVLNVWHFRYTPWLEKVRKRYVVNTVNEKIGVQRVVYAIVLDQVYPREADDSFRMRRGYAQEILIEELVEFGAYRIDT